MQCKIFIIGHIHVVLSLINEKKLAQFEFISLEEKETTQSKPNQKISKKI